MKDLAKQIKKFFKGEVLTDTKTLEASSHDASFFEVMPEVVTRPKTVTDIKNLVLDYIFRSFQYCEKRIANIKNMD